MTTSASVKPAAPTDAPRGGRAWLFAGVAALLALSAWRLLFAPVPSAAPVTELAGGSMGTTYSVKIGRVLEGAEHVRAERAVTDALSAVDHAASTYRPDSELSRFNQQRDLVAPFPLSSVLQPIIEIALQVGEQSGGALDITIGPLVNAWGFGPEANRAPSPELIAALRDKVGPQQLLLQGSTLTKRRSDLVLDLSSVAKGYAVDQIAGALEGLGHTSFLVEVGGELRARGVRPDGMPWRVGIEKPVTGERAVERIVALRDLGMATSGDYRNFYEDKGLRRSHLIDPRTGRPIEHALASVTVLDREAARADAWATALAVLGPTDGPKVAERERLAAFFIVREGPRAFRSIQSAAFTQAVSGESQ